MTSCKLCPKTTWRNYFESEGLAGGDFARLDYPSVPRCYCLAAKVDRKSKKSIIFQKKLEMSIIGNLIWLVLGGLVVAIIYFVVGLLMCITIIGIPFGLQLFKLGAYALHPFGHELVNGPNEPGCLSVVMNLLWILCGWWEVAIIHLFCGLIFCVSIIGIPLGLKHFSMALASIFPFGKEIR